MTPQAYALSAESADWVRRSQSDSSVPVPLVTSAEPGTLRLAWINTSYANYVAGSNTLILASVVQWLTVNLTTGAPTTTPVTRPITAQGSCYVYFPEPRNTPAMYGATVLAFQTGTLFGLPVFVAVDRYNLDSFLLGPTSNPHGTVARGDILYRNADYWTRLPIGTLGQRLTVVDVGGGVREPRWA